MHAGRWRLKSALVLLVLMISRPGLAGTSPRLVIVTSQLKGAPQLKGEVVENIEKPLGRHAELVSLEDFVRAARAAGLGPRASLAEEAAVPAGRAVRASYVLYIRSAPIKGRAGRRRGQAVVTLVDTVTGANALYKVIPTLRGHFPNGVAPSLVTEVQGVLNTLAGGTGVAQSVPLPPPTPASAPVVKPDVKQETAPKTADATPAPAQTPPPPAAAPVPAEVVAEAPPAAVQDGSQADAPSSFWRLANGALVQLGYMPFSRAANISQGGSAEVHYGANTGSKAPVFSRFVLRTEVMPARWSAKTRGHIYDRIGLALDLAVGAPATNIGSNTTHSSPAYDINVEAFFRQPLWHGPRATHASFRMGYRRYAFNLPKEVTFPGVGYNALALGLGLDVPLGTPNLAIVGQAHLLPALHMAGGQVAQLGAQLGQGLGGHVEAGLRLSPAPHFDITAQVVWSHYRANFVGGTTLAKSTTQYANVKLSDGEVGGRIMVGAVF